jgi:hypothetical protein
MEEENTQHELISRSLLEHELQGPDFLRYVGRPKYTEQIDANSDLSADDGKDAAILVCGPMVYESHFTRDTIRLYRKNYPNALIVLSTGEDEDADYLNNMKGSDAIVLRTPKPAGNGLVRRGEYARLQAVAAVQYAARQKRTYCVRSDTATRAYAPGLLSFFKGLQSGFPLPPGSPQKERFIFCGYGSFKYMPFCYNPAFQFAHMDDMLTYWGDPKVPDSVVPKLGAAQTIAALAEANLSCFFTTRYLQKSGIDVDPKSLRDSWRVLASQFCVVDPDVLDYFLYLPQPQAEERRVSLYQPRTNQMLSFRDWLLLNQNQKRAELAPECVLGMSLGAWIPS